MIKLYGYVVMDKAGHLAYIKNGHQLCWMLIGDKKFNLFDNKRHAKRFISDNGLKNVFPVKVEFTT